MTSEIERTLGPRASVVSYLSDAEQAVSDLNGVKSIALDSLVGAVGAAMVILFLVMVLIVRERKREIGILKAIGAPNGTDHGAVHDRGGDLHAARPGRRPGRRDHRGEPGDLLACLPQRGVVRHGRPWPVRRAGTRSSPT